MKSTEFYVLKNKDSGKYFYESIWCAFGVETIEEIMEMHGYYYDKDTAKSDCKKFIVKYCLDLEVVKIRKIVKYEELHED